MPDRGAFHVESITTAGRSRPREQPMGIAVIDDKKYSRAQLIHQIYQYLPQAEIMEAGSGVQAMVPDKWH